VNSAAPDCAPQKCLDYVRFRGELSAHHQRQGAEISHSEDAPNQAQREGTREPDVLVHRRGPAGSRSGRTIGGGSCSSGPVDAAARAGWEGCRGAASLCSPKRKGGSFLSREGDFLSSMAVSPGRRMGGRRVEGHGMVGRAGGALAAGIALSRAAAGVDEPRDTVTSLEWENGQWRTTLRRRRHAFAAPQ